MPEQPPPVQPAKDEPAAAVAVRVRTVPGDTDSEQVAPQLMPAGLPVPVTVPAPVPLFVTDSVTGSRLKVAVTEAGAVTVQVPVPEQPPPDQPAKDEPAAAVAVKVRTVPGDTDSEQVAPQLMPAGYPYPSPYPHPCRSSSRTASRAAG